ncbi:RpnC/YadD family protein [Gracilibacillus timonensis]|uniref:hypothetical protein n=1 Tax=Gracilibacillus timonensis TaxID=1816696 RepID=UPI000A784ABB|nr:hypothetical protein [Gracilibacillus timonensis]
MFPYFYRLYENHTEPIYAIALLTDASEANYEDQFHDAFYGTEITYRYNTYHFYGKDEEALKQSPNPFALVVLAGIYASKKIKIKDEHKKSKEQKKQEREETKFDHKKILVDLAYEKYRHHPKYLSALLYFIDYIMKLPDELQEQFYESLPIIQNEKEGKNVMGMEKLRDTPTFGRLIREIEEAATEQGLEQGMKQGMEKTERNVAKKLLDRGYSDKEISELTGLELKEVTKLRKSLEH